MPAAPLRIGVVGLGVVAQAVHLPLLAKHPDLFTVAAVCDVSKATRGAVGARLGVEERRQFSSAEELLAGGELDAIAILTQGSHGALAAAAARAGLAVFCEKPLAYTLAEADELAALDPRLMLGYMKLYDPAVERRTAAPRRPSGRALGRGDGAPPLVRCRSSRTLRCCRRRTTSTPRFVRLVRRRRGGPRRAGARSRAAGARLLDMPRSCSAASSTTSRSSAICSAARSP